MALSVLRFSIFRKILILVACVVCCAWFHTPIALAQHPGHVGGGGHFRVAVPIRAPHVAAAAAPHPMFLRPVGGVPERPFLIFPRLFFSRAPFFTYWDRFDSSWWLYCGPIWGVNLACNDLFLSAPSTEHYLAPPLTYETPVYVYSLDGHPLVHLFLKDGAAYSVNDYWFVGKEIHFTMLDETATKSVEKAIAFDNLDAQRTIDVNSRRGFRVVMRDEPIEQYLRDHPDLTPPLLEPPPKN